MCRSAPARTICGPAAAVILVIVVELGLVRRLRRGGHLLRRHLLVELDPFQLVLGRES